MPRPGQRPYECVRRAWHSDRHLPIRGSLIREIFRIVNEIHNSATRKNKEWQEKLPIVVLKAEEIMYSKANSEAEYIDLKTLWDRANDAIDTIIRRDESAETGQLLHPCIEAALNLGCTPRRASRSERNNNPRFYLNNSTLDTNCVPQGNLTTDAQFTSRYSDFMKSNSMNSTHLGLDSCCPIIQSNYCTATKSYLSTKFPPLGTNQCLPIGACQPSNLRSVYPLWYGNSHQSQDSLSDFGIPSNSNMHTVESAEMGAAQNLLSCNIDGSNKISQAESRATLGSPPDDGCDLSLRLGPFSVASCISIESSWPQEVEDVGSSTSREGSKLSDLSTQPDKEFSFFPVANADDPRDSCSSKWSSEEENVNVDATMRKRRTVASHPFQGKKFCWQPFHTASILEE